MVYDVSVVIPTLRREEQALKRAVDSCFVQGCKVQVVVVDDSPLPVADWRTRDVVWIHPATQPPGTLADALNLGHYHASGEYRFTMDDDDLLTRDGLGWLLKAIREAEKGGGTGSFFVYGNVTVAEGSVITPEWTPDINRGQFRTGNAMLWHWSLFRTVAAYYHPADLALYFEDYDFCAQLEVGGVRGMHVNTMVTYHRITAGGVTERARKLGMVETIRARINERYEG